MKGSVLIVNGLLVVSLMLKKSNHDIRSIPFHLTAHHPLQLAFPVSGIDRMVLFQEKMEESMAHHDSDHVGGFGSPAGGAHV